MLRIHNKKLISKALKTRLNFSGIRQQGSKKENDVNNNPIEEPIESPASTYEKYKLKSNPYIQMFNFMKRYFIPFANKNKELSRAIYKTYGLLTLSKICFFLAPFSLKYGINSLQNPQTMFYSPYCFLSYGLSYIFITFFEGKKATYNSKISLEAWKDISLETYRHLLNLDVSFHYNTSQKSRLFSLYKAHQYIEKNIRLFLNYFFPMALDLGIASVYLFFYFGNEFFLTFFATTMSYVAYTLKTSNVRRPSIFQQKENDKKADFIISESLANFYTVKHFNAENLQLQKYSKTLKKYMVFNMQNVDSLWQLNLGQKLIFASGLTLNLILAVGKVQTGALTPGDLVFLQALMMQIMTPLNFMGNFYREYSESLVEMKELFQLLSKVPKVAEKKDAKDYNYSKGEIIFDKVSFGYNENHLIIKDLTLKIQSGSFISIVGESGVGKSTLFSLLYRFYDPLSGEIFLDGQKVRDLKLESFRKLIGVASQQVTLFNDTILFNLQYANPNKTKEEIIDICKQVKLHEYIMGLPEGYETNVGEQGNKLSGGEKQRLSFARCLLKEAKIILLDEITSSLDSANENNIMNILRELRVKHPETTIIMVTHRLHLNNFTDKVILITKDGKIEEGKHKELLQQENSNYYHLWKKFCEKVNYF